MSSDAEIRAALTETLTDAIPGLTGYTFTPSRVNLPAVVVSRAVTRFDSVMARGADDHEYTVRVCVPWVEPELAQEAMSPFLAPSGDGSVKEIVDGNLGGVVDFARVREAGEETLREVAGLQVMTVDFVVEVTV